MKPIYESKINTKSKNRSACGQAFYGIFISSYYLWETDGFLGLVICLVLRILFCGFVANPPIKRKIDCYTCNSWIANIILKEVVVVMQSHTNLNLKAHLRKGANSRSNMIVFGSLF
jgi:hypothetical protein